LEHVQLGGSYVSQHWGQPVADARIGTWKEVLTPEQADAILEECPDIVQMFGYGKDEQETEDTTQ
tara:strand:- start:627 stop:821 length:195 start_codon:yes stop_codon:yes gene_type:complete